jgi:hypothetical protein
MFLFIFSMLCFANGDVDYINIKKGQHAPFSGKLLTNKSLAKIIAKNDADLQKCKADSIFNLEKQKLNLGLKYDLLNVRYKNEVEMYKSMIAARDARIASNEKKELIQKLQIYGSFVLGAASSIAIFYSVNTD